MVRIAQLVEHRIVDPGVAGSIPVSHPIFFKNNFICSYGFDFI